jgi:hypothetical protein
MSVYLNTAKIVLGVAIAAAIGTSAFAADPLDYGKNTSNSPRETNIEYKDGSVNHAHIRNDGFYGVTSKDTAGNIQHFVVHPTTGQIIVGNPDTGKSAFGPKYVPPKVVLVTTARGFTFPVPHIVVPVGKH